MEPVSEIECFNDVEQPDTIEESGHGLSNDFFLSESYSNVKSPEREEEKSEPNKNDACQSRREHGSDDSDVEDETSKQCHGSNFA